MKRVILTSTVIIVMLFICTGCFNPLQSIPDGPDSDNNASTQTGGTVRVSIPPYAPWLDSLMDQAESSDGFSSRAITDTGSRAFLIADRAVLTVFDSDSAQIAQETFDPAAFYFDEAGDGTVGHTLTLPAGTGYTIQAEIYNLDESTENPMVSGTSDPFAVTDGGETPVAITCLPESPAELELNTPHNFTQVSTVMDEVTGEPSDLGGETWVSAVVPANGMIRIDVDLPEGMLMGLGIFDAQGSVAMHSIAIYPSVPEGNLLSGDGYIQLRDRTPGETIYLVLVLIGNGDSGNFSLTLSDEFFTITGTVTVPGVTDASTLPGLNQVILVENDLDGAWISSVDFGDPVVDNGDLVYSFTLLYGGVLDGVIYGVRVNHMDNWPLPGDYFGATDGDPETPMDFIAGTGIEQTTFSGNVTGVEITMQLIEGPPVPASAFPDTVLRAALEEIIGKSFTGAAGGVTDGDLLALSTIDLSGRGEAYTNLTGLELCDNVGLINFDGNDLSGCDLGTGSGGLAYEALAGMDSLGNLQFPGCSLDELDFITGAATLSYLNIFGNTGISYTEQLLIDPVHLPNLVHIWYNGNRSTSADPVDDTEWAALVGKIAGFAELRSLGLMGFGITPAQFTTLYTDVLSTDPGAFTELDFRDGSLDNDTLSSLANLTSLEYLCLANNTAVSDVSALATANLSNLQALDLTLTSVTDLSPLQTLHGLGGFSTHSHWGYDVNVSYMGLDLWPGTANHNVVDYLIGQGVDVLYEEGNNLLGNPIPASAFPDNALRTAMEEIIGKSFTGAAGGVTDGDLLALSRIDLGERDDSYTELTGLELCDNVTLLQLDNNDLSGLDFSAASGTTNTVLTGMDGLLYLDLWNTGISSVEAIVSLSKIESLNLSGNHDLSYVEQKKINAANFPDMVTAIYTGYDSDGNGSCETMGATDWSDFLTILGEFTQLINLGMHNTYITPEQFDDLYTQVLSADPSRWSCIQFGSNLLDNGSLTQIANLPNVYELGLWYNPGITDISAITDMTSLDEVNFDGCGISDLTPLQTLYDNGGFTDSNPDIENNVRITYLGLDLWPGTANRDVIDYLIGEGVGVLYEDGNTIVGPAGGGSLEVIVY